MRTQTTETQTKRETQTAADTARTDADKAEEQARRVVLFKYAYAVSGCESRSCSRLSAFLKVTWSSVVSAVVPEVSAAVCVSSLPPLCLSALPPFPRQSSPSQKPPSLVIRPRIPTAHPASRDAKPTDQ